MNEDSTEICSENTLDEDNNDLDNRVNNTDMDELTLALLQFFKLMLIKIIKLFIILTLEQSGQQP